MNATTANQVIKVNVASEASAWHHHVRNLTPVVMLYLALAFYRIDGQSLWTDEASSIIEGLLDSNVYRMSPLYFILLRVWSDLVGTTEFALRSFSALLGVAAICITYEIGYKLFDRRTAVVAAILLATSPYFIWYAQEVRYISLALATSLVITLSFHRAISTGSWKWWVSYIASSLVALLSFVPIVFLIAAHGLFVLCRTSYRPMLRKWVACQMLTLLFLPIWIGVRSMPNLPTVLTEAPNLTLHEQLRSRENLPLLDLAGMIPYTFYSFSVGFSLGPSLRDLHVSRTIKTLVGHAPTLITVGILFACIFLVGINTLRKNRDAAIFLMLWLGVPILGIYIVATTTTFHEYNTRYVAMSLPAYILILARGIVRFRRSTIQHLLLSPILISNGISLVNYYFNPLYMREDARSAAQYLDSATQPGDVILINGNPAALQHYYKANSPVIHVAGKVMKKSSLLLVDGKLPEACKSYERIWLVEIRPWETDPKAKVKATLDKQARLDQHKSFPGVQIYSYQLTDRSS